VTRRWKIALRALAGAAILLPLGGWLYEAATEAIDARRFPPPGRLVDVGGRRLHLLCIGSGRPIVMFEASGFSNSASFTAARTAISRHTTVCSYDRAGTGWSDPAPADVSAGGMADDLRLMHERASLEPSFVIVASSIGGLVAEMFARRYPERVSGLVFVDAANSELLAIANSLVDSKTRLELRAACIGIGAAGRLGLIRLADPFGFHRDPSRESDRSAALMYGAQPWRMLCAVVRDVSSSLDEFARTPAMKAEIPVIALSAERSDGLVPSGLPPGLQNRPDLAAVIGRLRVTNQMLARRSTRGSWRLVRDSGHLIASDQPQAVVDAVLQLLNQLRGVAATAPRS
jgi:pimeloyl-ACP methyl ester carboxylesterase